jgi:hypothetical protein
VQITYCMSEIKSRTGDEAPRTRWVQRFLYLGGSRGFTLNNERHPQQGERFVELKIGPHMSV